MISAEQFKNDATIAGDVISVLSTILGIGPEEVAIVALLEKYAIPAIGLAITDFENKTPLTVDQINAEKIDDPETFEG